MKLITVKALQTVEKITLCGIAVASFAWVA